MALGLAAVGFGLARRPFARRCTLSRPFRTAAPSHSSSIEPAWNRDDKIFMSRALMLASRCEDSGDVPVGAILVRDSDGEVLAEAWNQREAEQKPLSHAETLAINAAAESLGSWRLDSSGEVSLYVTLEPCLMCYGAAALARIGRIVYGARSVKGGAISSGALANPERISGFRPRVVGGLMEAESSALIKSFFAKLRAENRK